MPAIVSDLGTTRAAVQLTLTGFFIGMGAGQLVIGPLSDAVGRKRLLILGAGVALAASAVAALAPSIAVLIAARVFQGLGGGACVVLSRAVVPDLLTGAAAAKAYSLLMALQGIAPALAPVMGGFLAEPIGWRGIFWVLTGLHALQFVLAILVVPETAGGRPHDHLVRTVIGNYLTVMCNGRFWGFLVTVAFGFCAMFSYISASSFVLQQQWGFSATSYSLIFAMNSMGMFALTIVNAKAFNTHTPKSMLRIGVGAALFCNLWLFLAIFLGAPVWLMVLILFFCIAPTGFIMGNATALATGLMREKAGSVSAIIGFVQSILAGVVSPLMGLGNNPALTMGIGMVVCSAIAVCGAFAALRKHA